jgi:anti-sigma regulatory factor (Ser/Thr protein kinase)
MVKFPRSTSAALPESLELRLTRGVEAPSIARSAVLRRCGDFDLSPSEHHTLALLVSEVVSNAVLHSKGQVEAPIVLTVTVTEEAVRVTVTDAGDGFTPEPRQPETKQGGFGLYLLEKAASSWGVDRVGGTRVWFELPRRS